MIVILILINSVCLCVCVVCVCVCLCFAFVFCLVSVLVSCRFTCYTMLVILILLRLATYILNSHCRAYTCMYLFFLPFYLYVYCDENFFFKEIKKRK